MTTLDPTTIENLSHAYNRMRAANEQLAFLSDITFGPTAIIAAQIERRSTRRWLCRLGCYSAHSPR